MTVVICNHYRRSDLRQWLFVTAAVDNLRQRLWITAAVGGPTTVVTDNRYYRSDHHSDYYNHYCMFYL